MSHDQNMLDREAVRSVIQQWNANRLDLFALSEPDENLLFHGVMRFYFQDAGQKVATKCIRVASDATVSDVIDTLIEKFRPDMRMLSVPNYALYEVHANGEERRLNPDEKPLLVQLNWHIDDREGRFLLKNIDQKTTPIEQSDMNFKRKLSKREKKEQKKKEKLAKMNSDATNGGINGSAISGNSNGFASGHGTGNSAGINGSSNGNGGEGETQVAGKLYTELPDTSFTRSISNPEAVMRRRRQQKLEKKLQQFRSRDGGPDTGGTLKIYGESLCQDVPYKTLLLSIRDCSQAVVREMLSKYGLEKADPLQYCLVQVNSDGTEYILDDDECPLSILMNHPTSRGSIMFHVRRRPADSQPRRRKKKPLGASNGTNSISSDREGPVLVEVTHSGDGGRRIKLGSDPVEVGSANTNCLQLFGPSIQPRHCLISLLDGVCTVTPLHTDALTFVNGHHITQPTILHNGSVVMFGRVASYRFVDSPTDGRYNLALSQSQLDSACLYESRSPTSPGSWNEEDGALSSTHKSEYDHSHAMNNNNSGGGGSGGGGGGGGGNNSVHSLSLRDTDESGNKLRTSDQRSHDVFDGQTVEGNQENETKSISSLKSGGSISQERNSQNFSNRSPKMASGGGAGSSEHQGQEPILPAVLEFPETHQELFLRQIITDLDVNAPHFKLAPVYSLYLCARYRASTHYRPELQPTERAHKLTIFLHHVANLIYNVVQEQYTDPRILAFWMANSSEFLHFLKSDRHISAFSVQAQEVLAETVQTAFRNLVNCFRIELSQTLNQFLSETIDHDSAAGLVLTVLGSAMALLRRCRVNAALTIQLFSQLFHYINVICFNTIVANSHMCTAEWGKVMTERLQLLELWAERQGLELAADCHLAKINQCAQFLQAPKTSVEEIQQLACSCFRLNSLQMAALLQQEKIPRNLVDTAIRMAESVADELTRADGREVRLEESPELHLALLLPDDGFSCDVVRGIPSGLVDFLNPLQQQGMCRLAAQPTSIGLWTVYMHQFNARSSSAMSNKLPQPEVQVIKLHKNSNGMGLSIVAAKGAGQERLGIYIKSVVPGGAADADGRLQAGDQLLRVDGQSLIGITQERAADYLVRTGPVVTLEVAKQGAIYHGLATLLQQPSPVISRDSEAVYQHNQRRHSYHNQQQARYFASVSDDSLNRYRRESFAGFIRSSSPPVRRLSASSLLEELCARGHQLHIDPRYRDTRPIALSASSLYLANDNTNVLHTFQNSPLRRRAVSACNTNMANTPPPSIYIEDYTDPDTPEPVPQRNSNESFTNFSYTEVHQPLNEDGIASVADSDEIPFIDDGSPTEEEEKQQQVYVPEKLQQHQPQPQPMVQRKIPIIAANPTIGGIMTTSNMRRRSVNSSAANYRKTVSFDLEETQTHKRCDGIPSMVEERSSAAGMGINRKFHTHDAISNFCRREGNTSNRSSTESLEREKIPLIQKIRRELNSVRSTSGSGANSGGSGSNSNHSSIESIERMPLLTGKQVRGGMNVTLKPRRELNTNRATSGGGLTANQRYAKRSAPPSPLPPPPTLVLSSPMNCTVNTPSFLSLNDQSQCLKTPTIVNQKSAAMTTAAPWTKTNLNTIVTINVPNKYETESSSNHHTHHRGGRRSLSHSNIHFPADCKKNYLTLEPQTPEPEPEPFSQTSYGEGKVREMANYFELHKGFGEPATTTQPNKLHSKSTSQLWVKRPPTPSAKEARKLTRIEQDSILKQLKEWSLYGSEGKDYSLNLESIGGGDDDNSNPTNNNNNNDNTTKPNIDIDPTTNGATIASSREYASEQKSFINSSPLPSSSSSCLKSSLNQHSICTQITLPGPSCTTHHHHHQHNCTCCCNKGHDIGVCCPAELKRRPSVSMSKSRSKTVRSVKQRKQQKNQQQQQEQQQQQPAKGNRRLSERDLTRMGNESKNSFGGPLIPNPHLSNSKSVPALHHHTGSGIISMANSKSRSTHSLITNSSSLNNTNNTGGIGLNSNEQGFYQNLSVYRAQNQSQPILGERPQMPLHSGMNTYNGNSPHNVPNQVLSSTNGTAAPTASTIQQQNHHQPHMNHSIPGNTSNIQPPNRPASAYYTTNNSGQQQQQQQHHPSQQQQQSQQQYPMHQMQNPMNPNAAHASLTLGNRSKSTQNFNRDMHSQHSLRMQQLMTPSMPNISNMYQQQQQQHQQQQQQQQHQQQLQQLQQAQHLSSQSMQNVNMAGGGGGVVMDVLHAQHHNGIGENNSYMQQHSPAAGNHSLRRNPRHELIQQQQQQQSGGMVLDNMSHSPNHMLQQHQHTLPPKPNSMQQQTSPVKQQQLLQQQFVPPTAPKPQQNRIQQQQQYLQQQYNMYQQQQQQQQQQHTHLDDKPPLPPTLTHPLYKTVQPQLTPGMNYVASTLDPPKGGYLPINSTQNQKNFIGTNPWEREEREKEVEMRRGHIRQWREEQIAQLSSLQQRTPQQEEQLKTLILERDFERRAQETDEQEDESEPSYEKENIQEVFRLANQSNAIQTPVTNFRQTEIKIASVMDNLGQQQRQQQQLQLQQQQQQLQHEQTYSHNHDNVLSPASSSTATVVRTSIDGLSNESTSSARSTPPPPLPNNPPPTGSNAAAAAAAAAAASSPATSSNFVQPKSILKNNRYDGNATAPSSPSKSQKSTSFADDHHLHPTTTTTTTTDHTISNLAKDISSMSLAAPTIPPPTTTTNSNLDLNDENGPAVPPPPPPERNSSYLIMSQQKQRNSSIGLLKTATTNSADVLNQNSIKKAAANVLLSNNNNHNNINNNNQNHSPNSSRTMSATPTPTPTATATTPSTTSMSQDMQNAASLHLRDNKRVSFHDEDNNYAADVSPQQQHHDSQQFSNELYAVERQLAADLENIREDASFLQRSIDASMLPSMPATPDAALWNTSVQSTPGVIGAQEVYRDPRQRRLAEKQQQQQQQRSTDAVPEKLSFKEKMKMFALESGEDNTPKDKLKISRAQRDIDAVH